MALPSARTFELLQMIDKHRVFWDPEDNTPRANRSVADIITFELHHTGASGPRSLSDADIISWLLNIERFHESDPNNWSDIFYHLFVFADGQIWAGRRLDRFSQNDIRGTLTVHVPGNSAQITEPQHESLLRIARWTTDDPHQLTTHNERASGTTRPSSCPGASGIAEVSRLREELTMTTHEHTYQDLGSFQDAREARQKALWDGSDPALAASRSVVAVIANRVDDAAEARTEALRQRLDAANVRIATLTARVETLVAQIAALADADNEVIVTTEVLDVIVAELQRRLAE